MKLQNNIIIVSFLLGNLFYSVSLEAIEIENTITVENTILNEISKDVLTYLDSKGLDKDSMKMKLSKISISSEDISKLTENISKLKYSDVVEYVGDSVLNNKKIDLKSYSGVIDLFQKKVNLIPEKEDIHQISKCL